MRFRPGLARCVDCQRLLTEQARSKKQPLTRCTKCFDLHAEIVNEMFLKEPPNADN